MLQFRLRFVAGLLAVASLAGCGVNEATKPIVVQQLPIPSSTMSAAPTNAQPTPTSTPTSIASPTARQPTTTPTVNAYAVLTTLALTPTRTPEVTAPPERIMISKIGLDAAVFPVDQDHNGNAVVLDHDVAWYQRSGTPGARTSIVLWAHVLRFKNKPNIPAPFERVSELAVGDRLSVISANKQWNYIVTHQVRVQPEQVEYLEPAPLERLVLVSCIGENVIVNGEFTKTERLITIAEPTR